MSKQVDNTFLSSVLICPVCECDHTHQEIINVYQKEEGQRDGMRVQIKGYNVSIDRDTRGNPSGKRQGLEILFLCEHCVNWISLTIAQHKGQTYLELGMSSRNEPDAPFYYGTA